MLDINSSKNISKKLTNLLTFAICSKRAEITVTKKLCLGNSKFEMTNICIQFFFDQFQYFSDFCFPQIFSCEAI